MSEPSEEKTKIQKIVNPTRHATAKIIFARTADDVVGQMRAMDFKTARPSFDSKPADSNTFITLKDRKDVGVTFPRDMLDHVEEAIKTDIGLSRAWDAARDFGGDVEVADRARTSLGAVLKNALAQNDAFLLERAKETVQTSSPVKAPSLSVAA